MVEDRTKSDDDLFQHVLDAARTGKPVVPLLGAGVSVCASIPFGPHIVDYLLRVKLLSESEGWYASGDYLLAHGWPNAHELNAKLLAIEKDPRLEWKLAKQLARVRAETRQAVMLESLSWLHPAPRETLRHLLPRVTTVQVEQSWVSLIHHVTGNRDHLVESFFDGLVRNRRPGNAHRFIACLVKRLGWRLILTTNFDDLIETALREEGLQPVVYELVRDGALPDKDLVARNLSVIKLHGGAFGLRTGFDLYDALDAQSLDMFKAYVPRDALLLVVGQGGTEPRIISLVEALIDAPHGHQRDLLWVHYDQLPDGAHKGVAKRPTERLRRFAYGDASLLFHELYQRLDLCHPVGKEAYQAIHHLPEGFRQRRGHPTKATPQRPSREDMWSHYDNAKSAPAIRLWFNLYQFTSVASFVSVLIEELQRNDRALPPLIVSPIVAFTDLERAYDVYQQIDSAEFSDDLPKRARIFCWHIAQALQRQRYVIAIDAVNGFANPQSYLNADVAKDVSNQVASQLRQELYEFLYHLSGHYELGESTIHVSPHVHDEPAATVHRPSGIRKRDKAVVFVAPIERIPPANHQLPGAERLDGQLLRVAISFRKPRSLTALVRLTANERRRKWRSTYSRQQTGHTPASHSDAAEDQKDLYDLDGIQKQIEALEKKHLLERQAGGLYSMNVRDRDELFERFYQMETAAAVRLQYDIAMYYRSMLYQQSRDVAAYLEYVLHRLACIDYVPGKTLHAQTSREGWQKLFGSLEREHDYVLGRSHAASLLDVLWCVGSKLQNAPGTVMPTPRRAAFALRLEKMCIEIRGSITDIQYCVSKHVELARARMLELSPLPRTLEAGRAGGDRLPTDEPLAALLREFYDEFFAFQKRFDALHLPSATAQQEAQQTATGAQLLVLCDLVEAVCCVAEGAGRFYVVRQDSDVPRLLMDQALVLVAAVGKRQRDSAFDEARLALLESRCYEGLMDITLRGRNPWKMPADSGSEWIDPNFEIWFDAARELLVEFGQRGQYMAARFAWLRCLNARKAYLSGCFEEAKVELNKAHAFGQRASGEHGATTMGVYYVHRAEYCILWAHSLASRKGPRDTLSQSQPCSLLDEALMALRQAESEFGRGRRDVFWTVRLFILRSRAYTALLSSRLKGRDNPAGALGEPDPELEQWTQGALTALYGAWINTHENPQRRELLEEIWDEIEGLWGADEKPATRWTKWIFSSGLEDFRAQRRRPWRRRRDGDAPRAKPS